MATKTVKEVKPVLERVSIPNTKKSPEIEELARKASNVLGYNTLANRILPPVSLGSVLKQLEIEPFSTKSVEQYKAEKLAEVKSKRGKQPRRYDSLGYIVRETVSWKQTPIHEYKKAIPEFALRKAVQIKEACPAADIAIDEITVTRSRTQPPRTNFDPFLVVSLGSERYYVEVWDEAKFEAKLF